MCIYPPSHCREHALRVPIQHVVHLCCTPRRSIVAKWSRNAVWSLVAGVDTSTFGSVSSAISHLSLGSCFAHFSHFTHPYLPDSQTCPVISHSTTFSVHQDHPLLEAVVVVEDEVHRSEAEVELWDQVEDDQSSHRITAMSHSTMMLSTDRNTRN